MTHTLFKGLAALLLVGTLGCSSLQPVLHTSAELSRADLPHPPAAKSFKMATAPAIALSLFAAFLAVVIYEIANSNDATAVAL
jgi:hypothetical protein